MTMPGRDASEPNDAVYDTAPPEEAARSVLREWKSRAAGKLTAALLPFVKQAAQPYLGGGTLDEALCVARRIAREGDAATLGYWDTGRENARALADHYLNALHQLSAISADSYLSIKPPALRYDAGLAGELAAEAARLGLRLHCDSHGPDTADRANAMLRGMIAKGRGLGTTLPGRWPRSLRDADWAVENELNVRVVKGQWPAPGDPARDRREGFLAVVDRLAGRARHVAVATHDYELAREALGRLREAGTSCELEMLLGYPVGRLTCWAGENGFKVRIYVPYGGGFVPNALAVLRRNPRILYAVAKERLALLSG
jgi:proline dehydrogenase